MKRYFSKKADEKLWGNILTMVIVLALLIVGFFAIRMIVTQLKSTQACQGKCVTDETYCDVAGKGTCSDKTNYCCLSLNQEKLRYTTGEVTAFGTIKEFTFGSPDKPITHTVTINSYDNDKISATFASLNPWTGDLKYDIPTTVQREDGTYYLTAKKIRVADGKVVAVRIDVQKDEKSIIASSDGGTAGSTGAQITLAYSLNGGGDIFIQDNQFTLKKTDKVIFRFVISNPTKYCVAYVEGHNAQMPDGSYQLIPATRRFFTTAADCGKTQSLPEFSAASYQQYTSFKFDVIVLDDSDTKKYCTPQQDSSSEDLRIKNPADCWIASTGVIMTLGDVTQAGSGSGTTQTNPEATQQNCLYDPARTQLSQYICADYGSNNAKYSTLDVRRNACDTNACNYPQGLGVGQFGCVWNAQNSLCMAKNSIVQIDTTGQGTTTQITTPTITTLPADPVIIGVTANGVTNNFQYDRLNSGWLWYPPDSPLRQKIITDIKANHFDELAGYNYFLTLQTKYTEITSISGLPPTAATSTSTASSSSQTQASNLPTTPAKIQITVSGVITTFSYDRNENIWTFSGPNNALNQQILNDLKNNNDNEADGYTYFLTVQSNYPSISSVTGVPGATSTSSNTQSSTQPPTCPENKKITFACLCSGTLIQPDTKTICLSKNFMPSGTSIPGHCDFDLTRTYPTAFSCSDYCHLADSFHSDPNCDANELQLCVNDACGYGGMLGCSEVISNGASSYNNCQNYVPTK